MDNVEITSKNIDLLSQTNSKKLNPNFNNSKNFYL